MEKKWTNFDEVTEHYTILAKFLEQVQDDALAAEGCSFKIHYPPEEYASWDEWLKAEV